MKKTWLLVCLLCLALSSCPEYFPKNFTNLNNTCVVYQQGNYYVDLRGCSANQTCSSGMDPKANVNCSDAPSDSRNIKYVGEKCTHDRDCHETAFNGCDNRVCKGMTEGVPIFNTGKYNPQLYCNPGFYYSSLTYSCQPKHSEGSVCDFGGSNYCKNNLECLLNFEGNHTCTKPFSVEKGGKVPDCKNNRSSLCETGFCKKNLCIEAPVSKNPGAPCKNDTDCVSSGPLKLQGKCVCGLSGNSFCTLFEGDMNQTMSLYKEYLEEYSHHCNTARKDSSQCMKDWWPDYPEYNYLLLKAQTHPDITNAPETVVEVFASNYYKAKTEYLTEASSSSLLSLGGVLFLSNSF